MLVVDILSLRAIDFLDLGEQIHLAHLSTLDTQNVVRVERTLRKRLSGFNLVTIALCALLAAKAMLCIVPEARKAEAARACRVRHFAVQQCTPGLSRLRRPTCA